MASGSLEGHVSFQLGWLPAQEVQAGVLCHFLLRCCLTTERMQKTLENFPDYQPFPRMGSGVEAISLSDLL